MRRRVVNLGSLDFGPDHPMTGMRVEKVEDRDGEIHVRLLEALGIFRVGDVVMVRAGEFKKECGDAQA